MAFCLIEEKKPEKVPGYKNTQTSSYTRMGASLPHFLLRCENVPNASPWRLAQGIAYTP
jgi:hypothetical protein